MQPKASPKLEYYSQPDTYKVLIESIYADLDGIIFFLISLKPSQIKNSHATTIPVPSADLA